ncbi:uncharacterized protein C2845_PM13G26100 [Panicum miliaceum]|uniref:Uncharacterized protein n=1 Tax=Panicum miliaceum TaxID=4540 RepID=A0A3L6RJI4_PANMI|nr:uncharacterized protein C2845_PM13G26100 [Panicum miliaceum]
MDRRRDVHSETVEFGNLRSTPSEEDARGAVNFNVENLDAAGKALVLSQNQRQPTADDTSHTVDVTDPIKDRDVLREHANDDIAKLNNSVFGEAGPNAAAGDPMFPEDPIDEINSQTSLVRLLQEEREQSLENFNEFQKMIFEQVGQRLKNRPRKYISPFKLPSSGLQVPLAKALALRNKIAFDEKLKE